MSSFRALENRETATSNLINLGKVNTYFIIKQLIKTMNQQSQVAFYVKCVSMTFFDIV